jgi:hypothetical protein
MDFTTCNHSLLNYSEPVDDFTVKAPTDPKLPGGGGYTITASTTSMHSPWRQ